jgi:hypothetical protein
MSNWKTVQENVGLYQQLAAAQEQVRGLREALALSSPWVGTDHMGEYFCMHCHAYMEDGHKSDCIYVQAQAASGTMGKEEG